MSVAEELSFCPQNIRIRIAQFSQNKLAYARDDKAVLLIGSGLTSVDVAVELRDRSFQGRYQ